MTARCERRRDDRRCGYALLGSVCPICGGRQVADRLPVPAPMPKRAETKPRRTYTFKRRGAA